MCHKNLRELEKIYTEFNTVRQISKHTVEFRKMFHERVVEFLDVYTEVKKITNSIFGVEKLEVSSLISNSLGQSL